MVRGKHPHFRVLFPEGFDDQAQRMAHTLEHIHEPEARTMGASPRKISVVLQNQSSVSNGFVTLLPRHSEFYTMPPQDYNFAGTNDWLNLLASHEYRHVVQYQHATRGFNRLFYYLFGNPTLAGMAHGCGAAVVLGRRCGRYRNCVYPQRPRAYTQLRPGVSHQPAGRALVQLPTSNTCARTSIIFPITMCWDII